MADILGTNGSFYEARELVRHHNPLRRDKHVTFYDEADEVLQRFGVQQTLRAIGDFIWGEGDVTQVSSPDNLALRAVVLRGYRLASASFPRVDVRESPTRQFRQEELLIETRDDEQTALSVIVRPPALEKGSPILHITEYNRLHLKDSSETLNNIGPSVKRMGLTGGLRGAFDFQFRVAQIEPEELTAASGTEDLFTTMLETRVRERKHDLSEPSDIRKWSDTALKFIPREFIGRRLSPAETKDWERSLRRT